MPSRLEDITIEIHERLNDATLERRFGRKELQHHDQERRIVWVRVLSPIDTPKRAGATMVVGDPEHRVNVCQIRVETVEAHIFAETDELIDQLLDNVIAACWLTLQSVAVQFTNYSWVSQYENEAGETLRTEKVVLRLSFRLPVPEEIKQLTPITEISHVCGTLTNDGDFNPQPED